MTERSLQSLRFGLRRGTNAFYSVGLTGRPDLLHVHRGLRRDAAGLRWLGDGPVEAFMLGRGDDQVPGGRRVDPEGVDRPSRDVDERPSGGPNRLVIAQIERHLPSEDIECLIVFLVAVERRPRALRREILIEYTSPVCSAAAFTVVRAPTHQSASPSAGPSASGMRLVSMSSLLLNGSLDRAAVPITDQ